MFVLDAVIDCSINRAQEGPQNLLLVQNKRVKKVVESQAPEIFSLLNVRTCAETQAQHWIIHKKPKLQVLTARLILIVFD